MRKKVQRLYNNDLVARVLPKSFAVEYAFVKCPKEHWIYVKSKPYSYVPVHVCPTSSQGTFVAKEILLMDRYIKPHDNVMMNNSTIKSGVLGYCENVESYVTIHITNTNKIIENVNFQHLTNTQEFHVNSYVVSDSSCVGKIYDIRYKVTFQSTDGSIFMIDDPNTNHFIHKRTNNFFVKNSRCYLGEIFKMCPESLDDAKFIRISNYMKIKLCLKRNCTNKYSSLFGSKWILVYVQDISISSVYVDWHWNVSRSISQKEISCPKTIIKGKDLKKIKPLNTNKFRTPNIGDQYFYTIKDTDNLLTVEEWHMKFIETKSNTSLRNIINTKPTTSQESTSSLYDTASKDSRNSKSSPATNLHIIKKLAKKKKRYPIELMESQLRNSTRKTKRYSIYKLKLYKIQSNRISFDKKKEGFNISNVSLKTGSNNVVTICHTKRFADVIWNSGERITLPTIFLNKIHRNDLDICLRTFVTKKNDLPNNYGFIKSVDVIKGTADVQWYKIIPDTYTKPIHFNVVTTNINNLKPHFYFKFTFGGLVSNRIVPNPGCSNIGQQINVGFDGRVLVMWGDGKKTECWPQNLCALKYHLKVGNYFHEDRWEFTDNYDGFGYTIVEYDYDAREYNDNVDVIYGFNTRQLYPILPKTYILSLLKQAYTSIKSIVETTKYVDKISELQTSFKEISTLLLTSEIKEKESLNNNLNVLIQIIDKYNLSLDNNEEETNELPTQTLIDVSRTIFKCAVKDLIHSVRMATKEL